MVYGREKDAWAALRIVTCEMSVELWNGFDKKARIRCRRLYRYVLDQPVKGGVHSLSLRCVVLEQPTPGPFYEVSRWQSPVRPPLQSCGSRLLLQ